MKEELISFETAKLAKEKGFFYKGLMYSKEGTITDGRGFLNNGDCSAPTQSLLQRWLRKKHKLILTVGYVYEYDSTPYTFFIYKEGHSSPINAWKYDYSSYEEALEEGLKTILNEIL